MGSKTPGNKPKQINISCKVCDLKFQTPQALRTHRNAKHPSDPQIRVYSPESAPTVPIPKNTPQQQRAAPPNQIQSSRTSKRLQLMKNGTRDTDQSENSEEQNTEEKRDKIEFACPKCSKVFRMYFQALKHIEKKHPEADEENTGSSSDSPALKPVRIEILHSKKVDSSNNDDSGTEEPVMQDKNNLYCLGCDKQFPVIGSFNKHAYFMHNEDADSMFFKNNEEFHMWQQAMETQVKMKYLALKKSTWQTYYQCNYVSPRNEQNKTYLCPSLILVKELQTGIHIRYGKKHYGHSCPEYELPAEFSHLLTSKRQDTRNKAIVETTKPDFDVLIKPDTDTDLLSKFQDLMGSITAYAAKISIPHLKKLFHSALQMQGILNSFDDDQGNQDVPLISKSMTDDQISNALEGKRTSARLKRKSETIVSIDPKKKKDIKSEPDENTNKTVLKENKEFDSSDVKNSKEFDSPKVTKARSSPLLSPSFVDSYKQFIGDPTLDTTKKSKNDKRKEIVKTKIGQFSPKKKPIIEEISVKSKPNILKPSKTNTSFSLGNDIKYEVREQDNDCNILILKI